MNETHIMLVGAGGIGGHLVRMLDCPEVTRVTVVDGDDVERGNVGRQQQFSPGDVGRNKAEAVCRRRRNWGHVPEFLTPELFTSLLNEHVPECVLLAVDNHQARAVVLDGVDDLFRERRTLLPVVSGANEERSFSAWIYHPAFHGADRDPRVRWPEINVNNVNGSPFEPSCSERLGQPQSGQTVFANMGAATAAWSLVQAYILSRLAWDAEFPELPVSWSHTGCPARWQSEIYNRESEVM